MLWTKLRSCATELKEFARLISSPTLPTFYAEDSHSYLPMEGYLKGLASQRPVQYLTGDVDDPVRSEAGVEVYRLPNLGLQMLPRLEAPVLVLTMPDLGLLHLARPPAKTVCVYVFHSLISTHRGYLEGAFDHYDVFFCPTSFHAQELKRRFDMIGRPQPKLIETGYYKLDRIALAQQSRARPTSREQIVLLAPSWHPENLLEASGETIVEQLLAEGLRVIVRPHPAFFSSVYPKGAEIVNLLKARFGSRDGFVLDLDFRSEASFHQANLMVCDWSGAAYEYALGTLRPVLFVEAPFKVRNPNWCQLGLPVFEEQFRRQVGEVVTPELLGSKAVELLDRSEEFEQRLEHLRRTVVPNFGESARVGTEALMELLENGELR